MYIHLLRCEDNAGECHFGVNMQVNSWYAFLGQRKCAKSFGVSQSWHFDDVMS